ncbi:MAG: hypothetical protein HC773_23490 [Scytonema sp. CRU_2_7]|nr:hypothetical protein [Scytonema sp. CRU_2_7]
MDISPVSDRTKHPPQRGDASDDPLRDGPKGTRPRAIATLASVRAGHFLSIGYDENTVTGVSRDGHDTNNQSYF